MTRVQGVSVTAVGTGPGLPPRGRHLILSNTRGAGKEELRERFVEDRDVVQRAGKNGPKGVANGALAGEIHDVEYTRSVAQLARPFVLRVCGPARSLLKNE
jgi:hypothetical protein